MRERWRVGERERDRKMESGRKRERETEWEGTLVKRGSIKFGPPSKGAKNAAAAAEVSNDDWNFFLVPYRDQKNQTDSFLLNYFFLQLEELFRRSEITEWKFRHLLNFSNDYYFVSKSVQETDLHFYLTVIGVKLVPPIPPPEKKVQ